MSEIEPLLFKLFSHFRLKNSNHKNGYLRSNTLLKMCEMSKIITAKFTKRHLEMMVHSIIKRNPNITFENFCLISTHLAEIKFPEEFLKSPKSAFNHLVTSFFAPLLSSIENKREYVTPEDLEVPSECISLIQSIYPALSGVYTSAFPLELCSNCPLDKVTYESERQLEKVLRAFDIFPSLITKSTIHKLWKDIVNMSDSGFPPALGLLPPSTADQGKVLSLSKFFLILYLCSQYGYNGTSIAPSRPIEKLLGLLERMELTRGKTRTECPLLPNPELLSSLLGESQPAAATEPDSALKHSRELQQLFEVYSSRGDSLNTTFLQSSNFQRLLRDSGIFEEPRSQDSSLAKRPSVITPVEIDLIFTQVTTQKRGGRGLDFESFLRALRLVACKALPHQESPLDALIQKHLLQVASALSVSKAIPTESISSVLAILKKDSVSDMLAVVRRSVNYFYKHYADNRELMDLDAFLRFYRDFEVFPDLISKTKLTRLFKELASQERLLDCDLFVNSIGLVGSCLVFEHRPSLPERICFLIERMNQSAGAPRVLKANGHNRTTASEIHDMTHLLKEKYPQLLDHSPKKKPTFTELVANLTI